MRAVHFNTNYFVYFNTHRNFSKKLKAAKKSLKKAFYADSQTNPSQTNPQESPNKITQKTTPNTLDISSSTQKTPDKVTTKKKPTISSFNKHHISPISIPPGMKQTMLLFISHQRDQNMFKFNSIRDLQKAKTILKKELRSQWDLVKKKKHKKPITLEEIDFFIHSFNISLLKYLSEESSKNKDYE